MIDEVIKCIVLGVEFTAIYKYLVKDTVSRFLYMAVFDCRKFARVYFATCGNTVPCLYREHPVYYRALGVPWRYLVEYQTCARLVRIYVISRCACRAILCMVPYHVFLTPIPVHTAK